MTGLAYPQPGIPGVSPSAGPDASPRTRDSARKNRPNFTPLGARWEQSRGCGPWGSDPTPGAGWSRSPMARPSMVRNIGALHGDHQRAPKSCPIRAPHLFDCRNPIVTFSWLCARFIGGSVD